MVECGIISSSAAVIRVGLTKVGVAAGVCSILMHDGLPTLQGTLRLVLLQRGYQDHREME